MSAQVFLQWWGEQLSGWLPAGLLQRLQTRQTQLCLQTDDDGGQLTLQHRDTSHTLGKPAELTPAQLQQRLTELPAVEAIALTLQPHQYLSRSVDLPLAAADNLVQAIGYQIETLTPFKRDQVWLFAGEQQRLPDGKRLRAWFVAVPRQTAQALRDLRLIDNQAAPSRFPRRAPQPGESLELQFRPARSDGSRGFGSWLLAGANLAVLAVAVGLHLDNRQAELDDLLTQSRAVQPQALAASDLLREIDQLQSRMQRLQQLRNARPTTVALLDEVSRRLDDQTWLQRFELRQQQLRLQGTSSNASALIAELDRSPLLAEVRFDASLTRDPRGGGERFNLTGTLQKAADQPGGQP